MKGGKPERSFGMDRTERPRKKKSRKGFIVFLVVAFVLYVGINVMLSYDDRLETMIVRSGSEEEIIETEGFVFREQKMVYSPSAGYVYCLADEDQRVKSGEAVVNVYKNEINVQANQELEALDAEIRRISASSQEAEVMSGDAAKVEQNIAKIMVSVPKLGYNDAFENLVEARTEIDHLIENKRIALGEIEPKDNSAVLAELRSKKAEIEKQHNIEKTVVYAPDAGAFTSRIDGMENVLTPEALENVSVEYLQNLKKNQILNKTAEYVESGAPVGKVVENFNWSVAAVVPTDKLEDIAVGDSLKIRFTDISVEPVEGMVSNIITEKNGKSVLVVKSEKYVEMIYSTSVANVQFIKNEYKGFRIPSKSIRIVDETTGVYILKNSKSQFVPVNILYNNKEWAIVSETVQSGGNNIKLYDELIISGKDLYDDKVVR